MGASGPNVAMRQMEGPGYKHIKQPRERGNEEEMENKALPGSRRAYSLVMFPPNEVEHDEASSPSTPVPHKKAAQMPRLDMSE